MFSRYVFILVNASNVEATASGRTYLLERLYDWLYGWFRIVLLSIILLFVWLLIFVLHFCISEKCKYLFWQLFSSYDFYVFCACALFSVIPYFTILKYSSIQLLWIILCLEKITNVFVLETAIWSYLFSWSVRVIYWSETEVFVQTDKYVFQIILT